MVAERDRLRTRVSRCRTRRARTFAAAGQVATPGDLARALRDHGGGNSPQYHLLNGAMAAPCMHAGGLLVGSQTTASWIAELRADGVQHWVTGTAAPCTGLFKPVRVLEPLELGPLPTDRADAASLWWRHERLHRCVLRDPARLLPLFAAERDALETRWWASPPEPAAAFEEGNRRLEEWTARIRAAESRDRRPAWVRRYWRIRDQRAGISDD
jgi:hypothetical protein